MAKIIVIGGGLAGCEAAWQAVKQGVNVLLFEMRPIKTTGAHKTPFLSELVCSNSLRSKEVTTGAGLLKEELRRAGSLIMEAAAVSEVSAGSALAVDRELFCQYITNIVERCPFIKIMREEVTNILDDAISIVATGPLTSDSLTEKIATLVGEDSLYFYDAIAPIIDAESIDFSKIYLSSRYNKGGDDYVNCPLTKEEYDRFFDEIMDANTAAIKAFEHLKVFEGCMPVEVMARRGRDTLRYGPLRPVGLPNPRTGKIPHAVVQLRSENKGKTAYNMVGFQTRMTWTEQKRIFRMIPGLEKAEFLRFGSIHRNTYINSPKHLHTDLSLKQKNIVYFAGQITGVEGYIESTAMGLLAGINAARRVSEREFIAVPRFTAHGSLLHYIMESDAKHFQPSNMHYGLFPADADVCSVRDKKLRRQKMADIALTQWAEYMNAISEKKSEYEQDFAGEKI